MCRVFCSNCSRALRHLHSFPTRRSSDLGDTAAAIQHFDRALEIKPDFEDAILKKIFALDFYPEADRKSTRLNSSHQIISYAVFCLKKKKKKDQRRKQ